MDAIGTVDSSVYLAAWRLHARFDATKAHTWSVYSSVFTRRYRLKRQWWEVVAIGDYCANLSDWAVKCRLTVSSPDGHTRPLHPKFQSLSHRMDGE